MSQMLGIVSNCWKKQLEQGVELDELIEKSASYGFLAVELRQTCLGRFESQNDCGDLVPDANALATLSARFPQLRFNVALSVPYLTPGMSESDPVFSAGKQAAFAVSGQFTPHLRLVDTCTSSEDLQSTDPADVARTVARLARSLTELDGTLSIENARQPWPWFNELFLQSRQRLGNESDKLRLCYDPCNLLNSDPQLNLARVTAALAPDQLSMVHFKQRRKGIIGHRIEDGDIDWHGQIRTLTQISYAGPYLFEVASHDEFWDHVKSSLAYLRELGFETDAQWKDKAIET